MLARCVGFLGASTLILAGCGASPDREDEDGESEAALVLVDDPMVAPLKDALSGGAFRCVAEDGASFEVSVTPASPIHSGAPSRVVKWTAQASWTGRFGTLPSSGDAVVSTLPNGRRVAGQGNHNFSTSNGWIDGLDLSTVRSAIGDVSISCGISRTPVFHNSPEYGAALRFFGRLERASSECFQESYYRAHNPDVASAIQSGAFVSGRHHYELHGRDEGRAACR